jgi:hypothetical protein
MCVVGNFSKVANLERLVAKKVLNFGKVIDLIWKG